MELQLQTFDRADLGKFRMVLGENGEPLFLASDVCKILDIQNVAQAMLQLDEDEKLTYVLHIAGQSRQVWTITESGLYSLIVRSNKPEAKAFKRWITHEVLPSIRKTGTYSVAQELSRHDILRLALEAEEENQKLKVQVEELAPKGEFYDAVMSSDDAITVGEAAKVLNYGQNTLFKFLRDKRILMKDNIPYQDYINRGYFKLVESNWTDPVTGKVKITFQTLVYQKGVDYIRKVLLAHILPQLFPA